MADVEYSTSEGSNQLIILKDRKRKVEHDDVIPKKKDPTGGKKNKNYANERQKERVTKKMKRQLAAVQQRKEKKCTQEDLFKSLAEYQLDEKKLRQLSSTIHMQDKTTSVHQELDDDEVNFPDKLKAFSGKNKLASTIHKKEKIQENYYPTDDETSDDSDETNEVDVIEAEPIVSELPSSADIVQFEKAVDALQDESVDAERVNRNHTKKSKIVFTQDDEEGAPQDPVSVSGAGQQTLFSEKEIKKEQEETGCAAIHKRAHIIVSRLPGIEEKRSQLPIYAEEVPIVEAINENVATIVSGETGSGKTTQIPQFLYEAGYANDEQLIGITEPRRVAAISMARRVGEELGCPELVSYQIRYEGTRTDKTRILFMTDGVLMKEMETDIMLKKYSAILIDEAHERSMYSDVLIGMLSRIAPLREKTGNPLRLVIMSATIRIDDFLNKRLFPVTLPKVINVKSRQYPVTLHFEKSTPTDYLAAAFRKTCRIHEGLPDGTILVFVSGQQEVKHLVSKLASRYPIIYERSKDGEMLIKGGKKWKQRRIDEAKNLKLEDFAKSEVAQMDSEDLHESGVGGDAWDDYEDNDDGLEDAGAALGPPPANTPPLYCIPLYSLLSSDKQKRVFEPAPEGARMCVIATNVAETSLTIPGVRYVVDSGFEKKRLYDPVTGVSQFVVSRVSQASADQRAGRAGRISAGHAYRLYSSAVFQDCQKYSRPEILDKPADQLVLHLKSMNIVKVVNFPFPSSPDADVLEAAEKRLVKMGALATTTRNGKTDARITTLGKTLSVFPLAPAYSKVIAMANQHNLMPYAISLIAALSIREPLIPVSSLRGSSDEETKTLMTEILKLRRGWCGKGAGRRLGDLLVLLHAVCCSEREEMNVEKCVRMGLRHKAMMEIRKLRIQLTNIVNSSFKTAESISLKLDLEPPTDAQAQLLRQMMIAAITDRIAKRVDRGVSEEDVPRGAYQTMNLKEYVFIDPCSVIYTEEPDYVIYQDIVQLGDKKCMQTLMSVDHEWLPRLAEPYCNFGKMDETLEPTYSIERDEIVRSVSVTFGPLLWPLNPVERAIKHDINMYRYFAQFLLNGDIMPLLKEYAAKLLAPPTTMVRAWAKLQQRTEAVLNALISKEVSTKETLMDQFLSNEIFLLEEYLLWLPESLHAEVSIMWPPLEKKTSKMGRNKKY